MTPRLAKSLIAISLLTSSYAYAELNLEQAIKLGISHHPNLEAVRYRELSANQNSDIARSAYYPRVTAMALATSGFPGSAGATGIGGLMISPFHKGPTAGLLVEQNIWDFGRTSESVRLAEKRTNVIREENGIATLKTGQYIGEKYFLCSKDRSLNKIYAEIATEAALIETEVSHFVKNGQKSIVDKYLSASQNEEAKTLARDYLKRFEIDQNDLAFLTGQPSSPDLCPYLEEANFDTSNKKPKESNSAVSLFILKAQAEMSLSETEKQFALKDFNLKIVGLGSLGYLQDTELGIPTQNYSVALGIIFPLFEGFKTSAQVNQAQLTMIQKEKESDVTKFELDEANITYDRAIESAKIRIENLKAETGLAETAFKVAKNRYRALQGTLVDLRETLRNLSRTSAQLKEAIYDLAIQNIERSFLNGEWNYLLATTKTDKN